MVLGTECHGKDMNSALDISRVLAFVLQNIKNNYSKIEKRQIFICHEKYTDFVSNPKYRWEINVVAILLWNSFIDCVSQPLGASCLSY